MVDEKGEGSPVDPGQADKPILSAHTRAYEDAAAQQKAMFGDDKTLGGFFEKPPVTPPGMFEKPVVSPVQSAAEKPATVQAVITGKMPRR